MLSGLFKRKDRKSKSQVDEDDSEWLSKEIAKDSPKSKASSENLAQDAQSPPTSPQRNQPQKQTSKLQKAPPVKGPASKRPPSREGQTAERQRTPEPAAAALPPPNRSAPTPTEPAPYVLEEAHNSSETQEAIKSREIDQPSGPQLNFHQPSSSTTQPMSGATSFPARDMLRPATSDTEPMLEKAMRAKERVPMDDFDSSPESENITNPFQSPEDHSPLAQVQHQEQSARDRLSESPVQVSPLGPLHPIHQPPPLMGDSSSQEERSISPESPSSTPELVEAPLEESGRDGESVASTAQLSSNAPPTWSDASLRTYLEDDTDIRDLLIVVHDKSDVRPAGPDHPIVANLCREENRRLGEMSTRLDGLLQDWLARKSSNAAR